MEPTSVSRRYRVPYPNPQDSVTGQGPLVHSNPVFKVPRVRPWTVSPTLLPSEVREDQVNTTLSHGSAGYVFKEERVFGKFQFRRVLNTDSSRRLDYLYDTRGGLPWSRGEDGCETVARGFLLQNTPRFVSYGTHHRPEPSEVVLGFVPAVSVSCLRGDVDLDSGLGSERGLLILHVCPEVRGDETGTPTPSVSCKYSPTRSSGALTRVFSSSPFLKGSRRSPCR